MLVLKLMLSSALHPPSCTYARFRQHHIVLADPKPSFATTLYFSLMTSPKAIGQNFSKPTSLSSSKGLTEEDIVRDVMRHAPFEEDVARRDLFKTCVRGPKIHEDEKTWKSNIYSL